VYIIIFKCSGTRFHSNKWVMQLINPQAIHYHPILPRRYKTTNSNLMKF
jgi:hypothetical protein